MNNKQVAEQMYISVNTVAFQPLAGAGR